MRTDSREQGTGNGWRDLERELRPADRLALAAYGVALLAALGPLLWAAAPAGAAVTVATVPGGAQGALADGTPAYDWHRAAYLDVYLLSDAPFTVRRATLTVAPGELLYQRMTYTCGGTVLPRGAFDSVTIDYGWARPAAQSDALHWMYLGQMQVWRQHYGLVDVAVAAEVAGLAIADPSVEWAWWAALPGDVTCDGVVDFADVEPFVAAVATEDASVLAADCNGDGCVDFGDVDGFVAALVAP